MALSPSDSAALQVAGKNFTGFFATLAFQTFFYGIYAVVFCTVVIVHLRKESMSRATLTMFMIIIGMFITTTVYYASSTGAMLLQLRAVLVETKQPTIPQRLAALPDLKIGYNVVENVVSGINFTVSDVVVVWRAWALSRGNRKIVIPSLVLLFCTIVSGVIFCGYSTVTGNPVAAPVAWAKIWAIDQLILETLSFMTNVSATIVIAWKAWSHRRHALASSEYKTITFGAESILMLLVESGFVYCFLQAFLVILSYLFRFSPNNPNAANIVRSALGGYFGTFLILSGLYPTLIILVVSLQRSVSESRMWRSTEVPSPGSSWTGSSRSTGTTGTGVTVTTEKWSSLNSGHHKGASYASSHSGSSVDLEKQQPLPIRKENGRTYF